MGYIAEPVGINLNISPMPLTTEDRQLLSNIIAHYKTTGEIPVSTQKALEQKRVKKYSKKQKTQTKRVLTT